METATKLVEVRKICKKNLSHIPDWIDNKSISDKRTWAYMFDLNELLIMLLSNRIHTQEIIDKILYKFNRIIDILIKEGDDDFDKEIELGIYYLGAVDFLHNICLDNELFEACENIKKFGDKFLGKINS